MLFHIERISDKKYRISAKIDISQTVSTTAFVKFCKRALAEKIEKELKWDGKETVKIFSKPVLITTKEQKNDRRKNNVRETCKTKRK